MTGTFDMAVVGGGIVGLATARELLLRDPGRRLVVLEAEDRVGAHQTGHNTGVIHAGIYYTPGSLKARLCVEGAEAMGAFCDEHGIPYERCGKLIVARTPDELPRLDALEARGRANGVPGLSRLDAAGIARIEPACTGIAALHSPGTGIVDYARVAEAIADDLRARGAEIRLGARVTAIARRGAEAVVEHAGGPTVARRVTTCAGLWSDRLAVASGAAPDPRIVPFRGAYLRLRPEPAARVRGMIYPVPDPALPFLGVHITRQIDGGVLLGPTALMVGARDAYALRRVRPRDIASTLAWPGTWRLARRFWRTGLDEARMAASRAAFVRACASYMPGLTVDDLEPETRAGVRAQAVSRAGDLVDDFVVTAADGIVHVRNAPSPAATSSLALARELADRIEAAG